MTTTHFATPHPGATALVLGGGGARGAYQAGVLRWMSRHYPQTNFPIMVGVSAGGVNVAHLAAHRGSFGKAVSDLASLWLSMTPEQVFYVDVRRLAATVARWGRQLLSGGTGDDERARGLVDTAPLRQFLTRTLSPGANGSVAAIGQNFADGRLRALALTATSYTSGQSVTWVEGEALQGWAHNQRRSEATHIGVDHVMASAALPLLFPAIRVKDEWFGDGGIRLTAPLAPALHLGARRILSIATRHEPDNAPTHPVVKTYPPPAQVLGVLYNAVFLDLINQDERRLRRLNDVLRGVEPAKRGHLRITDILVVRPSQDLGRIAREYEPRLPRAFRFLTRGLGTRRATSPDLLSLVMFQEDYVARLIQLGEDDAERDAERIDAFLGEGESGGI